MYKRTESDPVPCDYSEVEATSYPMDEPKAALGRSKIHPIVIDGSIETDQGEPVTDYSVSDTYYPFSTLNLYATSDPEYVPTGRPFVPTRVRRTPRQHGWTSGLYREEDVE